MMTSSKETFSALLVPCEGPSQRPVTWSFDVFFDLRLNKRLSTQSRRRWFETPSRSLWCHRNDTFGEQGLLIYLIDVMYIHAPWYDSGYICNHHDDVQYCSTVSEYWVCFTFTHWGRDKITAISQTCSNAFSWMEIYGYRLRFHWHLFLRSELTIFHHWFWQWLGTDQETSHYLNQWRKVYWRIYASHGLKELIQVQVQVFYFPKRNTWYNLQFICSSFLEGGRI